MTSGVGRTTPFVSAHGDEEKEMELVQQLAKTSLLFAIIIVVVVITEGKGLDTKTLLSSK